MGVCVSLRRKCTFKHIEGIHTFKYNSIILTFRRYNVEEMSNQFGVEGTRRAGT